ncbi:MAG: alpha-galactosidase [Anaerolineales bacterium]|nr:alpha-galactosidase [Anaerolineales bacterium]
MQKLSFDNQPIISYADRSTSVPGGYLLQGANVSLEFERQPKGYYRHGWQSWSLTTWQAPTFRLPPQKPSLLRPMQTDPVYVNHPAPNGSWLGAVDFEDGKVLLLGALGLESHVALHGQQLHGWHEVPHTGHEAGDGEWFVGYGDETSVFARYAELLGERLGEASGKPALRIWCSWYSLYTAIDEPLLQRVFDELGDLPFDVLQVDDGWQVGIGDWQANDKFPSGMGALAAKIRALNRTPGLWLAPLLVVPSSALYRQHRDWLLRDADGKPVSAGFNWGKPLYALDTTHPEVLAWLAALMKQVRAWGFDYLKLDFLYAGALPGKRHMDMPREAAYRQGLKAMREAMGADAYFLTCGAPILPSLGLCDAIRVGPDVAGEWESHRDAFLLYNPTTPGTKNAIRTTANRTWLSPVVATDPDVAYFTSRKNTLTTEQKRLLGDLALVCNFKAASDLPGWLSAGERQELRAFLEANPRVERTGRHTYQIDGRNVDFSPAMPLPEPPRGLDALGSALMGWVGNRGWALRLMDWLGKRALQKMKESL